MEVPILNILGSQIHSRPHKWNSYIWSIVKDSGKRVSSFYHSRKYLTLSAKLCHYKWQIQLKIFQPYLGWNCSIIIFQPWQSWKIVSYGWWCVLPSATLFPQKQFHKPFSTPLQMFRWALIFSLSSLGLHSLDCCATFIELNHLHFPCIWHVKSKLHISFFPRTDTCMVDFVNTSILTSSPKFNPYHSFKAS